MDFLKKHSRRILLIITIILIVVIILTSNYKNKVSFFENGLSIIVVPFQKSVTVVVQKVEALFLYNRNLEELNEENRLLKEQLQELQDENNRLSLFEKENNELISLLDVNQKYPNYEKIGAQIVSWDTSNWYNAFIIDRGEKDGIEPEMFVVAEGGLAGKVQEVGAGYAKVISVIDDRSSFHAQSKQTEDTGVVKGNANLMKRNLCRMEYIDLQAEIAVGDEIITSTLSIYPAGLTIGHVIEVGTESNGLTKFAIIEPSVSLQNLSKVLVVVDVPEGEN